MMTVGFTVIARPDGAVFQPFGQRLEVASRLMSFARDDLYTVLLIGRLYYCDEQLARLRGRIDEQAYDTCQHNHARLALTLCRIGGVHNLCRLEGDFALACLDHREHRLVALRDPMGGYPIFWAQQGETVLLSTSIRPLAERLTSVELDSEYALDYLVIPDAGISEMPGERTAYCSIKRLPAGWLLDVDVSTSSAKTKPYWNWREKIVASPINSRAEAGQLVRERLEAAVRERLSPNGATASTFSGGFDSTGVALLAERYLAEHGEQLHALSMVYERHFMLAQERAYIDCALEGRLAIVHHPILADDFLDFNDHQHVPLLDEPFPMASRFRFDEALVLTAAQAGVDTILSGEGSDQLFDMALLYLITDLLAKRDLRRAWAMARQFGYAQRESPWRILKNAARLLLPVRARDGIGPLLAGGRAPFENQTERTLPPWFGKDFSRRQRLQERALRFQPARSESLLFRADDIAFNVGDWYRWYISAPYGINITHPYWDPRLVSMVMGLPKMLHVVSEQNKPILASALHDILPAMIVRRSRKGHFGELLTGFARNRDSLEQLIRESPVDKEIIDKSVLIDCLQKAALGMFGQGIGAARLRITLSFLMWTATRSSWIKAQVPTLPLHILNANQKGCQNMGRPLEGSCQ